MNPHSEAEYLRRAALVEAAYRATHITNLADVRSQEAAKRALEVAVAGRHTITLTGNAPTDIRHLCSAFPSIGGDPAMIVDHGDILVVVTPATLSDIVIAYPGDATDAIRRRIARAATAIPAITEYDWAATQLLDRIAELNLDPDQLRGICRTIAALDGSDHVRRPHVGEALAYRWRPSR